MKKILIANRGEIAIRVARAAAELGIETLAICSEDDEQSLHTRKADSYAVLQGTGAAAYLDIDQVINVALAHGCNAVHPGYGFLSENDGFATACANNQITFIGPTPAHLA
ncbi:MAG: hypothetical protein KDI36_20400, partial [Pseudomonadales bacterium]|nr:hypothetical protein [Pseudomonadales bacterium]